MLSDRGRLRLFGPLGLVPWAWLLGLGPVAPWPLRVRGAGPVLPEHEMELSMTRIYIPAGLMLALACIGPAAAAPYEVSLLGEYELPSTTTFDGTLVGGLSSLDYDPGTGTYWAISDDRGNDRPGSGVPRFYGLDIEVTEAGIEGVRVTSVTRLRQPDGSFFADGTVDPEGLRRAPDGSFYWSSEGIRQPVGGVETRIDPFVRQADARGAFLREFAIPEYFSPGPDATNTMSGVRTNFGFESLALSGDGATAYTVNENALIQDGPPATFGITGVTRFLELDTESGRPTASYVYLADPPAERPNPPDATSFTGVVETLALDDGQFLMLERTSATGGMQSVTGDHFIEIYLASTEGATNVLGLESLAGADYVPMSKTLFADLNSLVPFLTNVEGLTWGPRLANGDRVLMLVGDNNFADVPTQFIALRVTETPEPASLGMMALGFGAVAAMARRLRRPAAPST